MSFESTLVVKVEKAEPIESEEFIGVFEGIASTPDIDLDNERFHPDVLKKNAEKLVGKPILFYHGKGELGHQPIGKILEARYEEGVGLKIKAGIYKAFKNIWEKIKAGVYKALSVGGIARAVRKLANGIKEIIDAEIREVSIARRGKNPNAGILFAFGKAFMMDEEGELVEFNDSMYKSFDIAKVDFSLPIVKRTSWDGDAATKRILDWATKDNGDIDKSKASKLFLVVEGDGKNRTDYSWPVGDIVNGKPVLVSSGILTAIKYAAGARGVKAPESVKRALERLAKRLVKEGILPEDYEVPWKRKAEEEEDTFDLAAEIKKVKEEILAEVKKMMKANEPKPIEKGENVEGKKDAPAEEPAPPANPEPANEPASAQEEPKMEQPKALPSDVDPKVTDMRLKEEARRVLENLLAY